MAYGDRIFNLQKRLDALPPELEELELVWSAMPDCLFYPLLRRVSNIRCSL
jgi:hypothetical protein